MAKRKVIGAAYKPMKDKETGLPKGSSYIMFDKKLKGPVTFNPGEYIRLESQAYQRDALAKAEEGGKLSGEMLADRKKQVEDMPDFVLAHLVIYED